MGRKRKEKIQHLAPSPAVGISFDEAQKILKDLRGKMNRTPVGVVMLTDDGIQKYAALYSTINTALQIH